ncbi:hypothetical protein CEXT_141821 [Caerostris extrusa]|uniref:Uncharacterized protein n=1 Tax=Caerostris extrusa TaxID=172846 RepID=A0AAV4XC49_CAEEX|nr:hypothetical protein CEXT_141821 [Caerostris extrusa]
MWSISNGKPPAFKIGHFPEIMDYTTDTISKISINNFRDAFLPLVFSLVDAHIENTFRRGNTDLKSPATMRPLHVIEPPSLTSNTKWVTVLTKAAKTDSSF